MKGMKRPEVAILPEGAVVPPIDRITPAPNQFTHEIVGTQPFYFSSTPDGAPPNGEFEPGTKVTRLVDDGRAMCGVVDARGLYVRTACSGLRRIDK
jgi:hypothetical protein